jgi:TrkA domain protein
VPTELEETRLPGIGTKYTIRTGEGCRLTVIQHNDGKRELYYFRRGSDDEPRSVITLDDDEARQLGAVLGGGLRAAEDRRGARDGAR